MKKNIFKGCGTALATPFTKDGINFEEFGKLIEMQIENGVKALIVCGTTGEAATMTKEERNKVIKFAVEKTNGRIPVIVGTGANNTNVAIELSKEAEELGADGLLVVTPYYNKATQEGLVLHYTKIAESVKLPIILYSVAGRTGVNILPETVLKLSKIDNIVAIKEASGNLSQIAKIKSLCGDDIQIYSGNDDQIAPIYSVGGIGVISVLSNIFPKQTSEMCEALNEGDFKKGSKMQLEFIEMVDALFCEVNPIPVKYALSKIGIDGGIPRLPLTELTDKGKDIMNNAFLNYINKGI